MEKKLRSQARRQASASTVAPRTWRGRGRGRGRGGGSRRKARCGRGRGFVGRTGGASGARAEEADTATVISRSTKCPQKSLQCCSEQPTCERRRVGGTSTRREISLGHDGLFDMHHTNKKHTTHILLFLLPFFFSSLARLLAGSLALAHSIMTISRPRCLPLSSPKTRSVRYLRLASLVLRSMAASLACVSTCASSALRASRWAAVSRKP